MAEPNTRKTIAVLNQKGGVGKTTSVASFASLLAAAGRQVLIADLDPQAHLTIHFGADAESAPSGTYAVLSGSAELSERLLPVRENLHLLGAGIDLVGAESELVNEVGRETILRNAIEKVRDRFDVILIDCPPSLGLLTLNALTCADEVIIPIQPHFLALQGFGRLLQTVCLVHQRINPRLRVGAILMCMYDSRTSLSGEVRDAIEKFLRSARESQSPWRSADLVPVLIRRNIKLAEAPSHGKSIFEYEPSCHGAEDYRAAAEYLFGDLLGSANTARKTESSGTAQPACGPGPDTSSTA